MLTWASLMVFVFWTTALVLGYIYAGYPLLLCLGHCLRRQTDRKQDEGPTVLPRVSLVIPAFNEEEVLREKLQNAFELDYPWEKFEVLVGDDCSADKTVSIARAFENQGLRLYAFPCRRGKASVVNDLIACAEGEVIMLCDANVMFSADALLRLVQQLGRTDVGAVTGVVQIRSEDCNFGKGESFYYKWERAIQGWEGTVGSLMGVDGGMYVLRKELFWPLPSDTILDDFVISMRVIKAGKKVVFEPTARATENATPHAAAEFRRRVRVSSGAVQSVFRGDFPSPLQVVEFWQYFSHKLLRWLMPLWVLVLFTTNVFLWNEGNLYRFTLISQLFAYSVAAIGTVSVQARGTTLCGIAFYTAMSFVAMAVGTARGLFWRQTGIWSKTERRATAT